MASAPPLPQDGNPTRPPLLSARGWNIVGAIALALITAALTYLGTAKLNNEAAIQQQYLVAVQEFSTTGAQVDASITELADTVLDGQQVIDARRQARQAIAAHTAAAQGLNQIIGDDNVNEYLKGVATLRLLVDDTNDKENALKTSNARFDLMDNRTTIINEARRLIYG